MGVLYDQIQDFVLEDIDGFDWDEGNNDKNWVKHRVHWKECEEIFQNGPVFLKDTKHSELEDRFIAIGQTDKYRYLYVVFTIRSRMIRIISSRDANNKEKQYYNNCLIQNEDEEN